jgi:hypothetical protein
MEAFMSKNWSKEDRHHFEKSEVMQGLETIVLNTIRRADILQEKIAQQVTAESAKATTEALTALREEAKETAVAVKEVFEADDGATDDETAEEGLQDEVVDDLRDLVAAALSEGNIRLAYRIERTIDEILEQDTPCL